MLIRYEPSKLAWESHKDRIRELALSPGVRAVCEVGGGANPLLPLDLVAHAGLEYTVLDISQSELDKAPQGYRKVLGDVASGRFESEPRYDLVFSRKVAEHVRDGRQFHQNVFGLLNPGGRAIHFFPTLYALPFTVNRLLPEALAESVLHLLNPGREKEGKHGKFPAYYRWCRGPSTKQLARLEGLGYEIEEYIGYFGHHGYYRKLKPLCHLHDAVARALLRHPIPLLTSYALVILRKPA